MRSLPICLWCLFALASCGSPPKPPTVDESNRRPANAAAAIELQSCRGELQNTRILALENARAAQASGSTVARLMQQQALAYAGAPPPGDAGSAAAGLGSSVRTVYFGFGSTQLALPAADVARLADDARGAALIMLRGRTDGVSDSAAESRIARERAEAVRALLLRSGVDPTRIRSTWQPTGDYAADNGSPAGRTLNRRVEIEIYRAAPRVMALGLPPSPAPAR